MDGRSLDHRLSGGRIRACIGGGSLESEFGGGGI